MYLFLQKKRIRRSQTILESPEDSFKIILLPSIKKPALSLVPALPNLQNKRYIPILRAISQMLSVAKNCEVIEPSSAVKLMPLDLRIGQASLTEEKKIHTLCLPVITVLL